MSIEDLGIAAVVVCNLLFLSLCTYMAWRMLTYMRDSQADLSAYADSLKSHAGRLNRTADTTLEVFSDVKRELSRLMETTRVGLAHRGGHDHGRPADPYQQWAARDPKALNRLIDQQGDMLDEVSKVDADRFGEWRRSKQVELDRLLQQKKRVQQEFEQLKQAHDEALHKLREQELRGRAHQRAAAEAGTLRHEMSELKQQLQQAQARAFAAEQLARAAEDAGLAETAPAPNAPRVKELVAQLAEAEADRNRLRRQLEQIQDNLKRTLTEKEFIEDRFLALDADRPVEGAASPPAAPDAPGAPTLVAEPA